MTRVLLPQNAFLYHRIIECDLEENHRAQLLALPPKNMIRHLLNTSKLGAMTASLNNIGLQERLGLLPFQVLCTQCFKGILCHKHSEG